MQVAPMLVGRVASWKERVNMGWGWKEGRNRGRFSTELLGGSWWFCSSWWSWGSGDSPST